MNSLEMIGERLAGTRAALDSLQGRAKQIAEIIDVIVERLRNGGAVFTCGNGGSAAEAMHLAEELIGQYRRSGRPPQRAVCLNADATALTCIANDFGYDEVFARQCRALLTDRDVLVALSTSGDSGNIVRALQAAREKGAATIGLLGKGGGKCLPLCDHAIVVDGADSAHIQEAHLVIIHLLCHAFERPAAPGGREAR